VIEAGHATFRAGVRAIDTQLNIALLTEPDGDDTAAFADFIDSSVPVSPTRTISSTTKRRDSPASRTTRRQSRC
jgi:hypothetical protein